MSHNSEDCTGDITTCDVCAEVAAKKRLHREAQAEADFRSGMPIDYPEDLKEGWRRAHPGGGMCRSEWCRCKA